jgi:hypothetical protein
MKKLEISARSKVGVLLRKAMALGAQPARFDGSTDYINALSSLGAALERYARRNGWASRRRGNEPRAEGGGES